MLRLYIKSLLLEAMTSPHAVSETYAIWSDYYHDAGLPPVGSELNFAMYDLESAKAFIKEGIDFFKSDSGEDGLPDATDDIVTDAISKSIVAVIRARVPDAGHGQCNGAWEIIRSAAVQGLGPTLYDIIMSISPQGLTSDRSSVSGAAKNVWSKYANQRGDIDKQLLDPNGIFTETEEDDCTMQGSGGTWTTSPLPKLHRQMAADFLQDYYPVEYEDWEEQQDPERLQYLQGVDGNDFVKEVFEWVEEQEHYDQFDMVDGDNEWFEWKMENEYTLIDNLSGEIKDPQQLNLSYNTDYAENAYGEMESNHWNLKQFMEEQGLDPEMFDDTHDGASLAVRDFFQSNY